MADEKDTYGVEFPRNGPLYQTIRPKQITPDMHFGWTNMDGKTGDITESDKNPMERYMYKRTNNQPKYLIPVKDHFTQDLNVNTYAGKDYKVPETVDSSTIDPSSPFYTGGKNQKQAKVFSGATTIINQEKDPDKEKVMLYGLEDMEYKRVNGNTVERSIYSYDATTGKMPPPTSPLHPFVRMTDPRAAQSIVNHSYNRYQYPISDIEHRKAFRNVFFTRPECYIMCKQGVLAQQCENDEDIATSFMRMPHICKMLSPVYVTHTFGTNNDDDNINYLLSNRITGLSTEALALSTNETGTKSIEGFSVVTGMHMESNQGGSLTVTFRDTKYLEVFEYFRVWMLYIYGNIQIPPSISYL